MDIKRTLAEQVVHRYGYAVGLFHGAEGASRFGKGDPAVCALPTFLLLGFALENAFASFLIACEHKAYNDYKKHDLDKALKASKQYGLVLAPENIEFVTLLAPYNRDFVFRYPEKMKHMIDDLNISDLRKGLRAVRTIIADVEVLLAVKGFSVDTIAANLGGPHPSNLS